MKVTKLFVHPIKSLKCVPVKQIQVHPGGVRGDREWMVIGATNRFVSQREKPVMGQIGVVVDEDGVTLDYQSHIVRFDLSEGLGDRLQAEIWNDSVAVERVSDKVDQFLTDVIGAPMKLVRKSGPRMMPEKYGEPRDLKFVDGLPVLLMSEESLQFLNTKVDHTIEHQRFRSNIWVEGGSAPHWEDSLTDFKLNQISFSNVKRCSRCKIVNVDTGSGQVLKEPLKTLAGYRLKDRKILFGVNLVPDRSGIVRIGDELSE